MANLTPTLLVAGGIFNLCFAVFHLCFWRLFRWKEDLASLTPLNRAVMQILNLCLTFVFLLMAYVSLRHGAELPTTPLGRTLLGGFALFWFLRLIEQLAFFDASKPRSLAFMLAFFIGGLLYTLPLVLGA